MAEVKQKIFLFYGNNSVKNQSNYKILLLILENTGYLEKQIIQLFEKNTSQTEIENRIRETNNLLKNFEVTNVILEITSGSEKENLEEITAIKGKFTTFKLLTLDEFIVEITRANA